MQVPGDCDPSILRLLHGNRNLRSSNAPGRLALVLAVLGNMVARSPHGDDHHHPSHNALVGVDEPASQAAAAASGQVGGVGGVCARHDECSHCHLLLQHQLVSSTSVSLFPSHHLHCVSVQSCRVGCDCECHCACFRSREYPATRGCLCYEWEPPVGSISLILQVCALLLSPDCIRFLNQHSNDVIIVSLINTSFT